MKVIYESTYMRTEYSPKYQVLHLQSFSNGTQSELSFRKEVFKIQEVIDALRPVYLLINKIDFCCGMSLAQRQWLYQQIIDRAVRHGMKKFAVVMSDNIYAQMALEEMFRCGNTENMMQYFSFQAEAYQWLISVAEKPLQAPILA